jgi:di/tripeptidase
MDKISAYCAEFAAKNGLECIRDSANNVIIKKGATVGYETHEPVILQGHIDMVCQKDKDSAIDFEKDGLEIFTDGDTVVLKKYQVSCVFCSNADNLTDFNGKNVCRECISAFASLNNQLD